METVLSPLGSAFGGSFGFFSDPAEGDAATAGAAAAGDLGFPIRSVYYSDDSDKDDGEDDVAGASAAAKAKKASKIPTAAASPATAAVRTPALKSTTAGGVNSDDSSTLKLRQSTQRLIAKAHPVPYVKSGEQLAILRVLRLFALYAPTAGMRRFFQDIEPHVAQWASAVHFIFLALRLVVELVLELCYEAYEWMRPYHPEKLAPALFGLVMCFFGGTLPPQYSIHLLIIHYYTIAHCLIADAHTIWVCYVM